MAAVAGLYRRLLPAPAVDFSCREGKELFREALEDGTMEGFFKLIAHFQTQAEPAFCGLASLAVVLNSLAIDPGRTWKGPWRWFDETMLDCCEPLEKVKAQGISFAKVACLGECSGARVEAVRADESSLERFRQVVKECSASEDQHMIASYNRQMLKQTGTGHFSPIGGYHEQKDMALILDVARFKYPPHWVPLHVLWDAVNTVDASTGKSRGYMIVTKRCQPPSLLFTTSCKVANWRAVSSYLTQGLARVVHDTEVASVEDLFGVILDYFPGTLTGFIKWIAEVRRSPGNLTLDNDESVRLRDKTDLLNQLRNTDLHRRLFQWFCSANPGSLAGNDITHEVDEACCQGAALLHTGRTKSCSTCKQVTRTHEQQSGVLISSSEGTRDDKIQVIVPTDSCLSHPMPIDIFAMLLLAQPTETWSLIQNVEVRSEFEKLVSRTELPHSLQLEAQHLQRQLRVLNCSDD